MKKFLRSAGFLMSCAAPQADAVRQSPEGKAGASAARLRKIDAAQMLVDVRVLSADAMEAGTGRRGARGLARTSWAASSVGPEALRAEFEHRSLRATARAGERRRQVEGARPRRA